jgi:hypothetical protein
MAGARENPPREGATASGVKPKTRADRSDRYRDVDLRAHPERYWIGRGEEGVLTAQPYKSELLPLWRFRTKEIATTSSKALWTAFVAYGEAGDFVGMDLARKFLQMGYTRARRYANHASGKKYAADGTIAPREVDEEKAAAADVFHKVWRKAVADPMYKKLRAAWEASRPSK